MTSAPLGQSVKSAVRFIRRVHRDAEAMLVSLEEEMGRNGWQPTEKNRISDDLSNAFNADGWIIKSVFRIYAPEQKAAAALRAGAIHLLFDPPDMYEEPQVLIAALKFPKATAYANLWNSWDIAGSQEVLKTLAGKKGPLPLSAKILRAEFFPDASEGRAFTVPLCGLNSEEDVRREVVKPLLGLLK